MIPGQGMVSHGTHETKQNKCNIQLSMSIHYSLFGLPVEIAKRSVWFGQATSAVVHGYIY